MVTRGHPCSFHTWPSCGLSASPPLSQGFGFGGEYKFILVLPFPLLSSPFSFLQSGCRLFFLFVIYFLSTLARCIFSLFDIYFLLFASLYFCHLFLLSVMFLLFFALFFEQVCCLTSTRLGSFTGTDFVLTGTSLGFKGLC